jgi:hypothetical protein
MRKTMKKKRARMTKTTYWSGTKTNSKVIHKGGTSQRDAASLEEGEDERMKIYLEIAGVLIVFEDQGSVSEIAFWFPGVFGRRIALPCGQVQSSARGALVGDNVIDFVFFFVIYDVRRRF